WSVSFYRESSPPAAATPTVIDVRGLEPPQPMVKVLEAIDRLEPGVELEVRHDRRPTLLYPLLDERGYVHDTDEPEPRRVGIRIRGGNVCSRLGPAPAREILALIPLGYLTCAAAAFLAAAAGIVWLAPDLAGHYYHPRVLALTHTVTLGWITIAIMGASYQL